MAQHEKSAGPAAGTSSFTEYEGRRLVCRQLREPIVAVERRHKSVDFGLSDGTGGCNYVVLNSGGEQNADYPVVGRPALRDAAERARKTIGTAGSFRAEFEPDIGGGELYIAAAIAGGSNGGHWPYSVRCLSLPFHIGNMAPG